jgi:hypothetical protein
MALKGRKTDHGENCIMKKGMVQWRDFVNTVMNLRVPLRKRAVV